MHQQVSEESGLPHDRLGSITVPIVYGLLLVIWFIAILSPSSEGTTSGVLLSICLVAAIVIVKQVVGRDGTLELSLESPNSLLLFFWGLYLCGPLTLVALRMVPGLLQPVEVGFLVLASIVSAVLGTKVCRMANPRSRAIQGDDLKDTGQAWALLALSYFAIVAQVVFFVLLIRFGRFYTRSTDTLVVTDSTVSMFLVFGESLSLMAVLWPALAARASVGAERRHAIWLLSGYSLFSSLVWVLSSSFRMALTTVVFFVVGCHFARVLKPKLFTAIVLVVVGFLVMVVIRTAREESRRISASENQLVESARVAQDTVGGLQFGQARLSGEWARRSCNLLFFLGEVIDASERGYDYMYFDSFDATARALVPRMLWPNKPQVIPSQIVIRRQFGLEIHDDAPGLIVYLYAMAGWVGVLGGFFLLGYGIQKLTLLAQERRSMGLWLLLVVIWSALAQSEVEFFLTLLATLRSWLLLLPLYLLMVRLFGPNTIVGRSKRLAFTRPNFGQRL